MEVVGDSRRRVGGPSVKGLDGLLKADGEKHLS